MERLHPGLGEARPQPTSSLQSLSSLLTQPLPAWRKYTVKRVHGMAQVLGAESQAFTGVGAAGTALPGAHLGVHLPQLLQARKSRALTIQHWSLSPLPALSRQCVAQGCQP